jgi:hypothetical protein
MTRVVPRPQRILGDGQPMGNLAHALLSVTIAGLADPARFRRGKAYVSQGAVLELDVQPGLLQSQVVGSRAEPYDVTVAVDLLPAPVRDLPDRTDINRLMPQAGAMVVSCTCPDWDDPCKHAVAVLLAFAGELTDDPGLLVEWRCAPRGSAARVAVGSRAAAAPVAHEPPDPFATPQWRSFFGEPSAVPHAPFPHSEPVVFAATQVHGVDLGALLTDAVRRVAR